MQILVTGAAGNVGQAVCRALVNEGFTVRMADMFPPSADDQNLGIPITSP